MKQTILFAGAAALCMAGAAFAKDNDTVTKTYDFDGFDSIDVTGVYELDVQVGPKFSIELSGDAEDMDRVEISVRNGVLHLDRSDRRQGKKWGDDSEGVEAVITMPSLTGLDVSGVVEGDVAGIDSDKFELHLSGVGDVELDGRCGFMDAHVSGVGELDARRFECKSVDIHLSGVGNAEVFASEEVDANVSGMGDIDVYGSPKKVKKSSSMFANVKVH